MYLILVLDSLKSPLVVATMSRKAAPKPEELIQKLDEKVDKFKVTQAAGHRFLVHCSPGGSDGQVGGAGSRSGQASGISHQGAGAGQVGQGLGAYDGKVLRD